MIRNVRHIIKVACECQGVGLPVREVNFTPCRQVHRHDSSQLIAGRECIITNRKSPCWRNNHTRKPATTRERIRPDVRNTVSDRHARKIATTRERIKPDTRHTIRDRDARKSAAIVKRIRPNTHDVVRDRHCSRTTSLHPVYDFGKHHKTIWLVVVKRGLSKRILTDTCYAVGDRHARKPATTRERSLPDARNAARYRHARKTTTTIERPIPDACHTVRYRNYSIDTLNEP